MIKITKNDKEEKIGNIIIIALPVNQLRNWEAWCVFYSPSGQNKYWTRLRDKCGPNILSKYLRMTCMHRASIEPGPLIIMLVKSPHNIPQCYSSLSVGCKYIEHLVNRSMNLLSDTYYTYYKSY